MKLTSLQLQIVFLTNQIQSKYVGEFIPGQLVRPCACQFTLILIVMFSMNVNDLFGIGKVARVRCED